MKFALGILIGDLRLQRLTRVTNIRERAYRATAIMMMVVFSLVAMSPSAALYAQQARGDDVKDASAKDSKRRKKKKSKRTDSEAEIRTIVLAPAVFPGAVTDAQQKGKLPIAGKPGIATNPRKPVSTQGGGVYHPTSAPAAHFPAINVRVAAAQEALAPSELAPTEIKSIDPPKGRPDWFEYRGRTPMEEVQQAKQPNPLLPAPSAQGSSPGPHKTFTGEFLSGSTIPPDTMGAVGTNHVVTVSNNQMNFRNRDGAFISRLTLNAFWAGVVLEGGITTPSTFDPKIFYDRFADKYFLFSSANSVSPASSVLFAVTQTNDPTGTWDRYVIDGDPTATGGPTGTGKWVDYPTIGFNKNWIVANYNMFNYTGTATTGYFGPHIYVIPKTDAYNGGTLSPTLFQAPVSTCIAPFNNFLGCGFTMAPTVAEDNTSETLYLVEDWDSVFGQLRLSKITGTEAAPVLIVGTQFPQSTENWRFNAARIGTGGVSGASGGYLPQRQQSVYAVFSQRVMANDSRINNAVLRNGRLWTSHHAMVGLTPTAPGTPFGTGNPDVKTAAQWWEIDPTVEAQPDIMTGLGTPPVQRGRIVDPNADNCNSGNSINASTERTAASTIPCPAQTGQFFAFVSIAVNQNNDALIGFSQFSPLTYPSGAYAIRRSTDPLNTTRDVVVFRSGASAYNIGAGSGASRQNRWGDYSASMVDPINDTDFWTNQEYSETRTNFGIGIAAPWATWWALVKPSSTQPTTTGNLIISEFRFRGPGGINDEFIELYNPSATTPHRVASVDGSEGWALASNNGVTTTPLTVIPQGVVVPPLGHYLIANSPVSAAAGAETLYYSLRGYAGASVAYGTSPSGPPAPPPFLTVGGIRTATADTGYSSVTAATDAIADNSGVALFKSSTPAAFIAANQADAAGFAGAGTTFREGAGITTMTLQPTSNFSYYRDLSAGIAKDTNDNAADFVFVDVDGTMVAPGVQRLGAPGPENVDAPLLRNSTIAGFNLDQSVPASFAPNRDRDTTPVTNGLFGTMTIRNRVINNTGAQVTRLRFRAMIMTTLPTAAGEADLRLLSSMDIMGVSVNDGITCAATGTPSTAPCTVTVRGLTLEEPPTQSLGGGLNSSVTAGTVTLATPLANGASLNVQFLVGVQQTGRFKIYLNIEALP